MLPGIAGATVESFVFNNDSGNYSGTLGTALTAGAWSDAGTSSTENEIQSGTFGWWSGSGLGIYNQDGEGSPQHTVDNYDDFDFILFDFGGKSASISEVTVGWWKNDADLTILAYEGSETTTSGVVSEVQGQPINHFPTANNQILNGWKSFQSNVS